MKNTKLLPYEAPHIGDLDFVLERTILADSIDVDSGVEGINWNSPDTYTE